MPVSVEALWLQVHLPFVQPLLVGCCYRPPCANSLYLSELRDMIEGICDSGNYLMDDPNINCILQDHPLKSKVLNVTNASLINQQESI